MVPSPTDPGPFSIDGSHSVYTVKFRTADQVSERDQLLVADSESSITEYARSVGVDYESGGWTYREIVCPSFVHHLFLQFTRNREISDVSMFSASIPRNGHGRVRVIPILKRSYSLFSPAPINATTISAFNHIRAEEGQQVNSDWLGNALCYAALAGADPEIFLSNDVPGRAKPIPALTAAMDISFNSKEQETLRFDDVAAHPYAMEWTMIFTHKGRLIKVTRKRAEMITAKPIPRRSPISGSRRIP